MSELIGSKRRSKTGWRFEERRVVCDWAEPQSLLFSDVSRRDVLQPSHVQGTLALASDNDNFEFKLSLRADARILHPCQCQFGVYIVFIRALVLKTKVLISVPYASTLTTLHFRKADEAGTPS